jgi:hypothetical protein
MPLAAQTPARSRRRGRASASALVTLLVGLLLLPITPDAARGAGAAGQFVLRCLYSHTLMDDPIVLPGQPGLSHSHDFFGNTTADAWSTLESLLQGDTTCRVPSDTAGYWTPTAYLGSQPIQPTVMRVYYLGSNADVETIPPGLQMIGGRRDATSAAENPHVRWSCGETKTVKTPRLSSPYDCTWWADQYAFVDGVIAIVDLPNCWDGIGLAPESVTYPVGGVCPAGFGHVLPRISERVHYGILDPLNPDGSVALTLSSGPYWTFHADFWNTWQQSRLDQLVADCIQARVHCGSVDASGELDWTRQFGTSRYDLVYAAAAVGDEVYVAGFTNFALDGQDYHHRYDAFVRKYDADGTERWTRQFGSSGVDQVLAIAADEAGVTLVGSTDGRLPKQQAAGGVDVLVARFGARGRELWVRQLGTRADDRATAVVDSSNGPVIAGSTEGALGERRGGRSDAFLAQLDPSGEVSWVRQFGTPFADEALGLALSGGVLYAVGWTTGPFHGEYLGGASDGFVSAFDRTGGLLWDKQVGTAGTDRLIAVAERASNVFVAGATDGALPRQIAAGGLDAFVARIDADGATHWLRQFGSRGDDEAVALVADNEGVYVGGSALGALPDAVMLGEWDGFVRKYMANGTQMWTRQIGTTDYDRVYGLSLGPTGLYLAGTTHGAFEGFTNAGDRDAFLMRVAFS